MKHALPLLAAMSIFSTQAALAHGIWTEQRYGHLEVVYGHGAEDEAYAPEKVKGVWAYDHSGHLIPVTVERLEDHARLKPIAHPAVLTVSYDNGIWSKNKDGKSFNAPRSEVPGAVSSSRSYKYSLAILEPHAHIPEHLKLAMVIRPLKDPMEVGVGNPLPVEVTIDGKPAANIALLDDYRGTADASSVKTDAQGRADIVIRNSGLNIIAAQARVPAAGEEGITERSLFTSLTFAGEAHHH
ncbi:DUF4198 domain-containing protein [Pseudomonas matsuisoli]|uniref:Nickel ABC transporter substrate-binding protein n=1 Tax=Pseudomonas matsuisoli TaxID=1515666 RepID=A0A917V0U2_9PSED|nr:DUF4198 domain-containing protein [Pseudomonas matsuisoli]GGK08574.1 nickel ABC transporter substrate-binding protein [Pseudomonas matsuisoli]